MPDPENVRMWREINKQSTSLATLTADADAACERVSAIEKRLESVESWRNIHDTYTATAVTRLTGAVDALAAKLEDRMAFEKSRWDKIWQIAQPILLALILAFVTVRSYHP